MKWAFFSSLLLMSVLACPYQALAQEVYFPEYTGFIVDSAAIIGNKARQQIRDECQDLLSITGTRLIVVTVNTSYDLSPREYARQLFNKWYSERKILSNSVLLIIYIIEGQVWIEMGPDLEPIMDPRTREDLLIKEVFQYTAKGRFEEGALMGVRSVSKVIRDYYYGVSKPKKRAIEPLPMIFLTIILLIFASMFLKTSATSVIMGGIGAVFGYLFTGGLYGIVVFAITMFFVVYFIEKQRTGYVPPETPAQQKK